MKKLICLCVSALLFSAVGAACSSRRIAPTGDTAKYRVENGGFESGDLTGWSAEGNAFSVLGISDSLLTADGKGNNKEGTYYFTKYNESAEGTLLSGEFEIGGSGFITFRLGGAMNAGLTYVSVVESETGEELFRFGNTAFETSSSDVLKAYKADLSVALGKTARIKIVDRSTANYGYICFDDFVTYYESEPDETYMTAEDVKPLYAGAESTPSVPENADFSLGLTGWQTAGEADCFTASQIDSLVEQKRVGLGRRAAFARVYRFGYGDHLLSAGHDAESGPYVSFRHGMRYERRTVQNVFRPLEDGARREHAPLLSRFVEVSGKSGVSRNRG